MSTYIQVFQLLRQLPGGLQPISVLETQVQL